MNTEFENTVTLSLNSYQNLIDENKEVREAIESITKKNSVVIGEWFNFRKTYDILNPNEAIIIIYKELEEVKKDNKIILDREGLQKTKYNNSVGILLMVVFTLLLYSVIATIILYAQSKA